MRAIIIDDENRSIDNLKKLIEGYCPEIEIIKTSNSVDQAFEDITSLQPDLIFLDIDMPPSSGFDLLKRFDSINFEIIFVTSYDYYAIDAIRFSALYYILKPIKIDDLRNAVEKAQKKLNLNNSITTEYIKNLPSENKKLERIVINSNKEKTLINLSDIEYIEADNAYTIFHLKSGKKVMCSQKTIKEYEGLLSTNNFFRCHRSYLVNISEIAQIESHNGDELILKSQTRLPLARRRKVDLKNMI